MPVSNLAPGARSSPADHRLLAQEHKFTPDFCSSHKETLIRCGLRVPEGIADRPGPGCAETHRPSVNWRGVVEEDPARCLVVGRPECKSDRMLSDRPVVAFVPSTDLARSRRFYEAVLDLRVVSEDGFAVVVAAGAGTIRITNVGRDLRVQPFTVLGWEVDDIDQVVDRLVKRGVEFLTVPGLPQDERAVWTAPDGTRIAWFKDPDGNTLSLGDHPA
jgi:catechol 2,3-dioxygenase-like lactoylglutathione lyase family enzyme